MPVLNKIERTSIVRKIMADCETEFDISALKAEIEAAIMDKVPPAIKCIFKDAELSSYINVSGYVVRNTGMAFNVPWNGGYISNTDFASIIGPELVQKIEQAKIAKGKHEERIASVKRDLEVAIAQCRTDKCFAETYPEYAKYLPDRVSNLPAKIDLTKSLKSIGFPKS